jgi:uncharacterized membrane protein YfcA
MEFNWAYTLAGALTGFVVGMTGIGGGALMGPILLIVFDIPTLTAVATDLWFAALTKIAAISVHNKHGKVDWEIVRLLWLGSLPVATLVIIAVSNGLIPKISGYLVQAIGILVLISSLGLLMCDRLKEAGKDFRLTGVPYCKKGQSIITVLLGALLGGVVSLTSVGAGVLGTLILFYCYSYRMSSKNIVSTEIAHAIPVALIAGTGYFVFGKVNLVMLISLLVGSIPAAILGAIVSQKISDRKLKIVLAIVLGFAGLKLVF